VFGGAQPHVELAKNALGELTRRLFELDDRLGVELREPDTVSEAEGRTSPYTQA
jgi:hypothetical protein